MTLRSKAAVQDSMLEDRQNLVSNPEAEKLFSRLAEVRKRLSALYANDMSGLDVTKLAAYYAQLDTLAQERSGLEQNLARLSARFREGRRAGKVTAEEVGQALPENAALVEFLHFTPLAPPGQNSAPASTNEPPPQYVAFILTAGTLPPAFIPIGEAEPIDRLIERCRIKMEQGLPVDADLKELYKLVWAPIESSVGKKPRLLISPDGALNQLPFAALRTPDNRYLIEQYEIGYLASGRDLIRNVDSSRSEAPALFGDPVFDHRPASQDITNAPGSKVFRSIPGDRSRAMYRDLQLPALPGTRDEIEQISKTLSSKNPSVFLGSEAAEESLKKTVRPEMLHLATHGFYFSEREETPGRKTPDNPMLRSGLALSGASASAAETATSDGEDGIVTAEEVGSLDLWGTRLVVLSACDTGRGETLSGEGVLGLRRAFVQAGTLNLMPTLWRVEDDFTKNLMLEFYQDYIRTGDAVGSLSRVQRTLLTDSEPRFWAPFLISIQGSGENK